MFEKKETNQNKIKNKKLNSMKVKKKKKNNIYAEGFNN